MKALQPQAEERRKANIKSCYAQVPTCWSLLYSSGSHIMNAIQLQYHTPHTYLLQVDSSSKQSFPNVARGTALRPGTALLGAEAPGVGPGGSRPGLWLFTGSMGPSLGRIRIPVRSSFQGSLLGLCKAVRIEIIYCLGAPSKVPRWVDMRRLELN